MKSEDADENGAAQPFPAAGTMAPMQSVAEAGGIERTLMYPEKPLSCHGKSQACATPVTPAFPHFGQDQIAALRAVARQPTTLIPGSPDKLRLMTVRHDLGLPVEIPGDTGDIPERIGFLPGASRGGDRPAQVVEEQCDGSLKIVEPKTKRDGTNLSVTKSKRGRRAA